MKIYFDNCSLQRPLDSKAQLRIILESEAVLGLIALCEAGQHDLITSEVLLFEVQQNPNTVRKLFALLALSKSTNFVETNDPVEARARILVEAGLKPLDALHLASAEEGGAEYLCTCDDRFLRRAQSLENLRTKVVSPVELISEIEK